MNKSTRKNNIQCVSELKGATTKRLNTGRTQTNKPISQPHEPTSGSNEQIIP